MHKIIFILHIYLFLDYLFFFYIIRTYLINLYWTQGHGFRNDLFQMVADLKPKTFRFPGTVQ